MFKVLFLLLAIFANIILITCNQELAESDGLRNSSDVRLVRLMNSLYSVSASKKNYYRAMQACKADKMELVSIESAREETEILKLIKNSGRYGEYIWISGTDLGYNGQFFWMGTGYSFKYTNWAKGEPSMSTYGGEREHCVELRYYPDLAVRYKWNDIRCSQQKYYVCEKQ